jgi:alpha-1,6-mannosyltransferase
MHICDLTTLYIDGGEGGVNTYLTEKARYFADCRDVKHTIIVPGASNTQWSLFRSTLYTLKSPRFFYNPHHRILTRYAQIKHLLTTLKPDLIEVDCAHILGHWVVAALGQRRVPLVGFYHTHLPSLYARPLTQRFGPAVSQCVESWAWRYTAYCLRPLDTVLVASKAVYERLAARTDKQVEHVALGVNLDLFSPQTPHCQAGPGRRPKILYVGRLSQEKDLDVLFEAFTLLNRHGTYQLQVVGDGPLRPQTERFVQSTPHTLYAGLIPYGARLAEVYASADVLALPSRNETFGLTVLEALASGLPVVAVNQGGPATLLQDCVGALATPGDPVDFAAKLAQVLDDRPLAHHCRSVAQHFSWHTTFSTLLGMYEHLLQSARPASQ